jgi:hypothetical protein
MYEGKSIVEVSLSPENPGFSLDYSRTRAHNRPVLWNIGGHAMASLSRRKPAFSLRPVNVGFVMDEVALDRCFCENFYYTPYSLIQVSLAL